MNLSKNFTRDIERRVPWVALCILIGLMAVVWRLADLQLVQGDHYSQFADSHGVRRQRVPAERGHIVDRHGTVLAHNVQRYSIAVTPQFVADHAAMLQELAELTDVSHDALTARYVQRAQMPAHHQVRLIDHASTKQIARVLAAQSPWNTMGQTLRGVEILPVYEREYPAGAQAAHVLGYLREINAKELEQARAEDPGHYFAGDRVGGNGLEKQWDHALRGFDGWRDMLVDARGRQIESAQAALALQAQAPQRGSVLRTSLDWKLQQAAHAALGKQHGAIVAIVPRTGEVLAMVTKPDYDTNRLQSVARAKYWQSLRADDDTPLVNRALRGAYPPGSTYKIVVAAAGIGEGVVDTRERMHCGGGLQLGKRRFGCWNRSGHGKLNLRQAMEQSCDVFFYELGKRLTIDRIAQYARKFGFGELSGIDLPYERSGLQPTREWKQRVKNKAWQQGDTYSASIGQGYNLATPLQVARMIAIVANDGYDVRPHFVASQYEQLPRAPRIMSDAELVAIMPGLIDVVEGTQATAKSLQKLNLKIAGKTGTSQVIALTKQKDIRKHRDHAWFAAYAPYDDPQIAVAVFVEHGGGGGSVAAPIAGEVIEAYLTRGNDAE